MFKKCLNVQKFEGQKEGFILNSQTFQVAHVSGPSGLLSTNPGALQFLSRQMTKVLYRTLLNVKGQNS